MKHVSYLHHFGTLLLILILLGTVVAKAQNENEPPDENGNTPPSQSSCETESNQIPLEMFGGGIISVDKSELVGARLRKVSLSGRLLPSEKPQAKPESDQLDEETYIDPLNFGLVHSITDFYLPGGPGCELNLQVRRDYVSEVWTGGNAPSSRYERAMGPCWSVSSVVPYASYTLDFGNISTGSSGFSISPPGLDNNIMLMTVIDEVGAAYTFKFFFDVAKQENVYIQVLNVGDKDQSSARLEVMNGDLVLKKKYGGRTVFSGGLSRSYSSVSTNTSNGGNVTFFLQSYIRIAYAEDRYGNQLVYDFDADNDGLIPDAIRLVYQNGTAGPQLSINHTDGLITDISDSLGNTVDYEYSNGELVRTKQTINGQEATLTAYAYAAYYYPDTFYSGQGFTTILYNQKELLSLADANNNTYSFVTQPHLNTALSSGSRIGAVSRAIHKVILPGNLGETVCTYKSNAVDYNDYLDNLTEETKDDPLPAAMTRRLHEITDTEGNATAFEFYDPVLAINNASISSASNPSFSFFVVYQKMNTFFFAGSDIAYVQGENGLSFTLGGNTTQLGQEHVSYQMDASLSPQLLTDLSGNSTTYEYTDEWMELGTLETEYGTETISKYYADPTKETNTLGESKEFTYTPIGEYRLMATITEKDAGVATYRTTEYTFDSYGNRTSETVKDGAAATVKLTEFEYGNPDFPGFMTQKTVKQLSGASDPAWVEDLITLYVPGTKGQLEQEVVDLNGNGVVDAATDLITSHTYDANNNKLTTTDPEGNTTSFDYDERNRLVKVTYADTSYKQLVYDAAGNKISETDENGNITLYEYDALRRLVKQARDMDGNGTISTGDLVTEMAYNGVGSKTSQKDAEGNETTFEYDALQRLVKQTAPAPLSYETTFAYGTNSGSVGMGDGSFKPTSTTDPRGYVTTVVYDALYRPTETSVAYSLSGSATTEIEYDAAGNVIETTDPLDISKSVEYDALDRPVKVTHADGELLVEAEEETRYTSTGLAYLSIDALDRETETEYDRAGRPVKIFAPEVDNGFGTSEHPVTETLYDKNGNVAATINPLGNRWDFSYDVRNRKIKEEQPAVSDMGGASIRPEIETEYDSVGNVTRITDARDNTTETEYDKANRPVKVTSPSVPVGGGGTGIPVTETTYDLNGNVLTVKDANGHTVTNTYDELNRLLSTADAANITVAYQYDEAGNRTRVTDGKGNRTDFAYDGLNRNTSISYAQGTSESYTVTFAYDALNKTSRTDGNGKLTSYIYDARHRLTDVTYTSGDVYHDSARSYTYDLVGNLLSVTEPGKLGKADAAYTYDDLNRVITETSSAVSHTYKYDLAGNRLFAQYGSAAYTLVSGYDALNRLDLLRQEFTAGGSRETRYEYDLNGNITKRTLPNSDETLKTYDALNRMIAVTTNTAGATQLSGYTHTYDLVGNVVTVVEDYATGGLSDRTVTNTYDDINRLLSEAIATTGAGTVTTSYTYDDAHNRTQKSVDDGSTVTTTSYTFNALNQMLTANDTAVTRSYTYDSNGNRASRSETRSPDPVKVDTYTYDMENRLVGLVKASPGGEGTYAYTYDYRTRRVERSEASAGGSAARIVFSGGTSVQEYALGASNPDVEYIRGSDYGGGVGGILYTDRAGVPSYTHYNNRGDVVAKTSDTGALTYQAAYEAFGTRTSEQGSTSDRQKANTKDEDPTGLLNEGFRYRDLETGSFITRDPLGFVDGPNVYSYVVQNPWTFFDPEGLRKQTEKEETAINNLKTQAKDLNKQASEYKKQAVKEKDKDKRKELNQQYKDTKELAKTVGETARTIEDLVDRMTDDSPDISGFVEGRVAPWFKYAAGEVGQSEWTDGWNPRIKEYMNSTDVGYHFTDDGTGKNAWCAAFCNWAVEQGGGEGLPGYDGVRAKSWLKWGEDAKDPNFGTIGVMKGGGHHVGVVVGTTKNGDVAMLGGNQGDAVNVSVYPKSKFKGFRQPAGQTLNSKVTLERTSGLSGGGSTR
ncbi:MAG: TIGR02594 family protein [Verrucomicrobiota bacterium]